MIANNQQAIDFRAQIDVLYFREMALWSGPISYSRGAITESYFDLD